MRGRAGRRQHGWTARSRGIQARDPARRGDPGGPGAVAGRAPEAGERNRRGQPEGAHREAGRREDRIRGRVAVKETPQFEDWERERLERATGVLSTVGPDGGPHAAPVMVGCEGAGLRFETKPESRKVKNLSRSPRVAVTGFGQPKWGVVVRGKAEVLTPGGPPGSGEQAQILVHPESKVSWRRKEPNS